MAWAFTKMQHLGAKMVAALARAAQQLVSELNVQDASDTSVGC